MEPLPAGARLPPSPPRPTAPPTTGWLEGPESWPSIPAVAVARRRRIVEFVRQCVGELRKTCWPDGPAIRNNAGVMVLTVVILVAALGMLDLALGALAGGLVR